MNFIKNYYAPTPVFWRKIGDTILLAGTTLSSYVMMQYEQFQTLYPQADLQTIVTASFVLTVIGKCITNFFSVSETKKDISEN
jgi:hypothetical protein